jgi:hypothetical protein
MDKEFIGVRLIGIKPEDLRAGELAKVITSFEDMIASTVKRDRPQISKDELVIGLVQIENKSVGLEFTTKLPELALPAYYSITDAVATERYLDLPGEALKHLREFHSFIKAKNCECEMFSRNGKTNLKAILLPKTIIPEHPKISGEITLYGRIVRVGGEEPRVMFEQPNGKSLFCRVKSEDLARQLGERLYTWVGLIGIATFDSDTMEVTEFKVEDTTGYEGKLSIKDSISELSTISRQYYADVSDVESYVTEIRS